MTTTNETINAGEIAILDSRSFVVRIHGRGCTCADHKALTAPGQTRYARLGAKEILCDNRSEIERLAQSQGFRVERTCADRGPTR